MLQRIKILVTVFWAANANMSLVNLYYLEEENVTKGNRWKPLSPLDPTYVGFFY